MTVVTGEKGTTRGRHSPAGGKAGRGGPSRALVLGSGGVLGFAWMLGALEALEAEAGLRAHQVDLIVGTSAGSVGTSLLSCGVGVEQIIRYYDGAALPEDVQIVFDHGSTGSALPPPPALRPGSPELLLRGLRHPNRMHPLTLLSGALPPGRGSLRAITELVEQVELLTGHRERWPTRPQPWIVATDYGSGERVVFGRDELTFTKDTVPMSVAATASCSLPGWYPPTKIGERMFIDGGAFSSCSVDLLADTAVDEVYVFAPMAAVHADRKYTPLGGLERSVRRSITRKLEADVATVRAAGKRVVLLTPNPEDLAAIGLNLMNPRRREQVLETSRRTSRGQLRELLAAQGAQ